MPETFYLTTPIYYVNARPHIGHAYTTIVADVLARRHRLLGDDTFFLTGTDEHGQKIERSAAARGIPPQAFADEVSASFRTLWQRMGITNDRFIRTTDPDHKLGVQALWKLLEARGQIYLSSYTGQYCVSEEIFVEGPPGTIGPDGKPTETVTEENYFFRLGDYQLRLLNLIESDELLIRPEARKNELLSFLRGNVNEPGKATATSTLGHAYVPGALRDLSISRSSFTWGIPVPGNDKHVIYVWLDALANYMTAVGYGDPARQAEYEKWWPADLHLVGKEITRQHCIYWPAFLLGAGLPLPKAVTAHGWLLFEDSKMSKSKGNIVRTETILEAFGEHVYGKQFPDSTKQDRDLFAADVLRYFLLREIPFGQDGSFTFEALVTRYNADLANGYGNLVSRTLSMIQKYFDGRVPALEHDAYNEIAALREVQEVGTFKEGFTARLLAHLDASEFDKCLQGISVYVIGVVDKTLSMMAPWKERDSTESTDQNRRQALYYAAESIRIITTMLYPIIPFASNAVWGQLGYVNPPELSLNSNPTSLIWGALKAGTNLGAVAPIFPRADKGLAQIMSDMEAAKTLEQANAAHDATPEPKSEFGETPIASEAGKPVHSKLVDETFAAPQASSDPTDPGAGPRTGTFAEANPGATVAGSTAVTTERTGTPSHTEAASGIFAGQPADSSPQITIDDFAKVELRIAKVIVCERIPKADKLLRLEVDLGYEKRQILSGIAEWYTPEDLLGRRIVVITNLAPRKMRGLESHGMLLAASSEGGKPALATFLDSDDLPLGSRLK